MNGKQMVSGVSGLLMAALLLAQPACKKDEPSKGAQGTQPGPVAPASGEIKAVPDSAGATAAKAPAPEAAKPGPEGGEAAGGQAAAGQGGEAAAADGAGGQVESKDILGREPVTERAQVKHVLVAWKELAPAYRGQMDQRAAARTREEADKLALEILAKIKAGGDIDALMKEHSEDPGSAQSGQPYEVTPAAGLVPPFKALSLRLNAGEAGVVETVYGWHIIKRIE